MGKSKKKWKRRALKWRGVANASISAHHYADAAVASLTEEVHSLIVEKKAQATAPSGTYNVKVSCSCGGSISIVSIMPDTTTNYFCPSCKGNTLIEPSNGAWL